MHLSLLAIRSGGTNSASISMGHLGEDGYFDKYSVKTESRCGCKYF